MDFNFSNLSTTNFSSNAGAHLEAFNIHKVNLTKIEKTELKGSKDPNAVYPIVALEFTSTEGNKGTFTANLFIPRTQEDAERRTVQNSNGHESQMPSRVEEFQFYLMQIVHAINPEGEQKIKDNASKIKNPDQFIDIVIKVLKGKENVETNLKLVGRLNNGTLYASLPRPCGVNRDGELFPINFIGENLYFNNYEIGQQKRLKEAKPTNMETQENNPDKSDDSFDLDGIEI